jgi:histidine triad (HIT) family protein
VVPREHRRDIWDADRDEAVALMAAAHLRAGVVRDELGAVGVNLRQNSGGRAGQDVFHFHLHLVPRYADDTVQPGCVWGDPPWQPPAGGDEERRRVAEAIRRGVVSRRSSATFP